PAPRAAPGDPAHRRVARGPLRPRGRPRLAADLATGARARRRRPARRPRARRARRRGRPRRRHGAAGPRVVGGQRRRAPARVVRVVGGRPARRRRERRGGHALLSPVRRPWLSSGYGRAGAGPAGAARARTADTTSCTVRPTTSAAGPSPAARPRDTHPVRTPADRPAAPSRSRAAPPSPPP